MKKRVIALMLALTLTFSSTITAFAENGENVVSEESGSIVDGAENIIDVDTMTDAELLAYYSQLSDEKVDSFAVSLTEEQLNRLSNLLQGVELCSESSETHTVFKNTESTLAPGVTQNIKYAYAADGKQMVYYVATADVTRDDVVVQSSYLNQYENGKLGMSKLTEQIAYANQKYTNSEDENYISDYYNVVAGVNSSFYNMQTGQPMGITFIDGVSFGTTNYDNFFAILKDGKTAVIDYASNLGKYVDENGESTIWQAAAGSQWLVRDGQDVTAGVSGSYNTDRHSRTCVGVTAEGKVILMVLDGRQEPFSCGGSMHELAQIMLEAGCVAAINLDGGGSTTFVSKAEGADEVSVVNRPSDGSERSISAGIIIATTTVPSNTFDHVSMTAADEYVTPGTSTEVTVSGVSPAGTAAEIPENVTYNVTNGTYEAGILTANGEGDVVLTACYDGKDVGTLTIHAVIPEKISFSSETITVPYDKSLDLEITATYGLNEVKTKAEDFKLFLEDDKAGTLDSLTFIACSEDAGVESSKITAEFVEKEDLTATATIKMGKGSEVLWDFEDGDISEWTRKNKASYNYILTPGTTSLSSKANGGIVHSGDYALKFNMDFSVSTEGGYISGLLGLNNEEAIDLGGATSLGMWLYVPIEAKSLNGRIYLSEVTERNEDGSIKTIGAVKTDATMDGDSNWNVGFVTQFEESGWHYISFDLTNNGELGYCIPANATILDIYVNDRDNTEYNYNHLDYSSLNQNVVMYVDDVTLDYSSVVDDREAPIFSEVTYADTAMSDAASLNNGATITGGNVAFAASVTENTEKANATGLDESTAKAYIDGKEVTATFDGSKISVSDVTLVNGNHTVKFSICDKQGNYASVIRTFTVNATGNDGATIQLKAHDESLDKILLGSVYYVDFVATEAQTVNNVVVDLDLNNMSNWELDHMDVAEGFTASYSIIDEDENIARVTITRTGSNSTTGELALISIPIRTWELPCVVCDGGTSAKGKYATYEFFKKGSETWPIDISLTVKSGILNEETTFAGDNVQVDTESYVWDNDTKPAEYATWNGGHDHRAETKDLYSESSTNHVDAIALEDKAATCTEDGYTGRTYCEVCDSVVDWGTTVEATGHTYESKDGVLKCECGDTFTGTWTDGKEYVDGVVSTDGWKGDSYYKDGIKLTGIQKVPAPDSTEEFYYDFGENGVSKGKYTGLFFDSEVYKYAQLGELSTGWKLIDENVYYFDNETFEAVDGKQLIDGYSYEFENNILVAGQIIKQSNGLVYMWAGSVKSAGWFDTKYGTYLSLSNHVLATGRTMFRLSTGTNQPTYICDFTENGVLVNRNLNGIVEYNGNKYFVKDSVVQYGVQQFEGDLYYFRSSGIAAVGKYFVSPDKTNNLLDASYYVFDEDGKLIKDGWSTAWDGMERHIVNGKPDTNVGLIVSNEDIYYVDSNYGRVTGKYYVVEEELNNILDEAGYYIFDEDGKLIKDGWSTAWDGQNRHIINGRPDMSQGLITIGEEIYYIRSTYSKAIGKYYVPVDKLNGLLNEAGYYVFDEDGKFIKEGWSTAWDGYNRHIINGQPDMRLGMVVIGEDTYYIRSNYERAIGKYYVPADKLNDLLNEAGYYVFDEDGKFIKEGWSTAWDGTERYIIDGQPDSRLGLVLIGEDVYYIRSTYTKATGKYYVPADKLNGMAEQAGYYVFDEDGKFIEEGWSTAWDGIERHIINGQPDTRLGLITIGNDIYYIRSTYTKATGRYYVPADKLNGILEAAGFYNFDENGKLLY